MAAEYLKISLEVLKVIVWPILILIVYFSSKDDFSSLIRRVNKASIFGNEIAMSSDQPKKMVDESSLDSPGYSNGGFFYDKFGVMSEIEKEAWQIYNAQPDEDKIKKLINVASFENYIRKMQWVYIYIFGSQIELMELISAKLPSEGVSSSEVMAFFEQRKNSNRFLGSNIEFYSWINFLTTNKLVNMANGNYYLSNVGRAFLSFLIENQLNKNKGM
ncbi:hypothetical protein [Serratia liquefaciens]|uniref:hypothetical protein n=1 Tax=Serratia liquefaciens TaxID=614 RepID=UPI0005CB0EB5|nr:hypothetical protein [Serratia liquefaciens]